MGVGWCPTVHLGLSLGRNICDVDLNNIMDISKKVQMRK